MNLSESQRRNLVMALLYGVEAVNGNTWTSLRQRELIVPKPDAKKSPGSNDSPSNYRLSAIGESRAEEELACRLDAIGWGAT